MNQLWSQFVEDDIRQVFDIIVADYDSGELQKAIAEDAVAVRFQVLKGFVRL